MNVLLDESKEFSLSQAWSVRRDKAAEDLNQEGLQLLDQIKLGQCPVGRLVEKLPEFALGSLLLC